MRFEQVVVPEASGTNFLEVVTTRSSGFDEGLMIRATLRPQRGRKSQEVSEDGARRGYGGV